MNELNGIQILCLILLGMLLANLASETWSKRLDRMDQALIQSYFGIAEAKRIERDVLKVWDIGPKDSIVEFVSPPELRASPKLSEAIIWGIERIDAATAFFRRAIRRVILFSKFDSFALLLTILSVMDGFLKWKAGKTSFAYSSPLTHRISILGVCFLSALFPISVLLPLPFLPALIPYHLLALGLILKLHIAHLPKRL